MIALFRRNPAQESAELAYRSVVEHARRPVFFIGYGVPDTLDGRFEIICLHAFLYLHRLKAEGAAAATLGQSFFDTMFADFDRSLREMGTGDLSVGREVKHMAQAFYGRIRAYERGLDGGDSELREALARNLFGTVSATPEHLEGMAAYLRDQVAALQRQEGAALLRGRVVFAPPPELPT